MSADPRLVLLPSRRVPKHATAANLARRPRSPPSSDPRAPGHCSPRTLKAGRDLHTLRDSTFGIQLTGLVCPADDVYLHPRLQQRIVQVSLRLLAGTDDNVVNGEHPASTVLIQVQPVIIDAHVAATGKRLYAGGLDGSAVDPARRLAQTGTRSAV